MDSMNTPLAFEGIFLCPCNSHKWQGSSPPKRNPSSGNQRGAKLHTDPTSFESWWRHMQGMDPPTGTHQHWSPCKRIRMGPSSNLSSPSHLLWPSHLHSIYWRTGTWASHWGRSCLLSHCFCIPWLELYPQRTC